MPKQLGDLESILITKGRDLLFTEGYSAFSMRRVASECGVAVGTLYNYVADKNELIAKLALADWNETKLAIDLGIKQISGLTEGLVFIRNKIREFRNLYSSAWSQFALKEDSRSSINAFHSRFRGEVSELIRPLLKDLGEDKTELILPVLSELVITAATHGDISDRSFTTFISMIDTGGKNE